MSLILLITALASSPASAQSAGPVDNAAYVETNRPRMSERTLTGAEARAAQNAIATVKSRPSEEALLALKRYAESGDKTAMLEMVKGYVTLNAQEIESYWDIHRRGLLQPNPIGLRLYRTTPLAGLWGAAYYQRYRADDFAVVEALKPCVGEVSDKPGVVTLSGTFIRYDCGFDTSTVLRTWTFSFLTETKKSFKPMKPGSPALLEFRERMVIPQAQQDAARFSYIYDSWLERNPKLPFRQLLSYNDIRTTSSSWDYQLDKVWAQELAFSDPNYYDRWVEAAFEQAVRSASGNNIRTIYAGSDIWRYMKADPVRERRFENAFVNFMAATAAARSDAEAKLSSGAQLSATEKNQVLRVATEAGGALAQKAYQRYGAGADDISVYQWCNIGVETACKTAREELAKAESQAAAGGGNYVSPDLDEQVASFKRREAAINRANCARASMGASIICNN